MEHGVANQNEKLIQNIKLLEQGISLNDYLKRKEEIKINDIMKVYNKCGVLFFLDETRKLFEYTFHEELVEKYILNYILDSNLKIYRHYQNDEIILKLYKYDNDEELQKIFNYYHFKYEEFGRYHYNMEKIAWENDRYRRKRKKFKSLRLRNIAISLLQLKSKSSFLYELLNAIADLLVKSIPIFVYLMISSREQIFVGMSVIQKLLFGGFFIAGIYVAAVLIYLSIFIVIRIVMLVFFRERLEVKFKIFDTIIDLTELDWRDFE